MKFIFKIGLLFITLHLFFGCYSLVGSSLNKNIKTAKVFTIVNNAPLKNLGLANNFTNSLTNRIDERTNLTLTNEQGDISIKGEITKYELSFANISSEGGASQNRLSIGINIIYENKIEPLKNFTKLYEDYENFNANLSLSNVESSLVQVITEKLIDKIFNDIITDW
ncbi:MAG: LPS assembly lipoprotein LptE [Solirubrobacteraceae bacterium]